MPLQTEIEFTLPLGYMDGDGTLHKDGVMRLATAADEILPMKDPRVQSNPAYLTIIVLSRVILKIGGVSDVNPRVIENLYATDVSYLQSLYQRLNGNEKTTHKVVCPNCEHRFEPMTVNGEGLSLVEL
ncbi:MAG: hypothetical protein LKG23_06530 [Nitrospira sp.]|nr:hypothetical protein [Nitrospira sp.]